MTKITQDTLNQLNALNRWLSDVFEASILLSNLLSEAGLSEDEIAQIKAEYLMDFVQAVIHEIATNTVNFDGKRRNDMMVRHYGLLTGKRETLQSIGDEAGLSRERIRQLVQKRLRLYRHPKRKEKFKADLATMAHKLLNNE